MHRNPWLRLMQGLGVASCLVLPFVAMSVRVVGQTSTAGQPQGVTFTKDIAPILQRSCQNCHRPGSVAPMSLLTYEEVRPWARAIKTRTASPSKPDVMPPWYMERNIGIQQYKDDMSLSDEEIAKVAAWVDSGAPQGNPANMPPPRKFADASEWQIGKPDLIVSSTSFEMPAQAPDYWGPLGKVPVPTGLTEDRYVAAVEVKEVLLEAEPKAAGFRTIGGQSIIHHLGWAPVDAEGKPYEDSDSWPTHEVGRNADFFDAAAGKLLKAGAKLTFGNVHGHAIGKRTKSRVDVGFKFHPIGYQPTKKFAKMNVYSTGLSIDGLSTNQKAEGFFVLPQNVKLVMFEPHMHAAGVRMCLDAIWMNTQETMSCAGYNHSWVRVYTYQDDAQPLLPKGTILRVTGYFDTTPANKNVSDPRNWSGLGHRSMDNMSIGILNGLYLTDEDFEREIVKRREKLQLTDGQTVIGCPLCGYLDGWRNMKAREKKLAAAGQVQ